MRVLRWCLGILVVVAGVITLSYLQNRFDHADLKKAVQALEGRVEDVSKCVPEVVSRFRGHVRVKCGTEEFLVDIVKGMIGGKNGKHTK
jgi:hypothetical protein